MNPAYAIANAARQAVSRLSNLHPVLLAFYVLAVAVLAVFAPELAWAAITSMYGWVASAVHGAVGWML